jgi:lysophospholipase L1-like esterase
MKEQAKNILLLIGALAILAVVLEISARFLLDTDSRVNVTGVPKTIRMESPYDGIKYLLRPNGFGTQEFGTDPRNYFDDGAVLSYKINSLGFRGAEVAVEKPGGILRIIGLGDSFTFGTGVRNEDTFLSVLQNILNTNEAGKDVEVLNLGAPAYNTTDEVNLLSHIGLNYEPDIVVICFFLNDAGGGGSRQMFNVGHGKKSFWRENSRLVDYLSSLFRRRNAAEALVSSYERSFRDNSPGWEDVKSALQEAKRLSDENDFRIILVIFPVLWDLTGDYPFASIHSRVSNYAKVLKIPVLDLQPAFNGFDGPELWVHPNNQHPNEIAHRVAAEALARFILENHMLREADGAVR